MDDEVKFVIVRPAEELDYTVNYDIMVDGEKKTVYISEADGFFGSDVPDGFVCCTIQGGMFFGRNSFLVSLVWFKANAVSSGPKKSSPSSWENFVVGHLNLNGRAV